MRNMSTSHTSDTTSLGVAAVREVEVESLRFEEEVAGEFGKERQLLTEAVIKAFQNGWSSSPFLKAFITASVRCCRSFSGNPQDFFTHSLHCCEPVSSLWFPGHSLQVQKLQRQSGL